MILKEVHPGLVSEKAVLLERQVGTSTILQSNTKQAWLHFIAGGAGGMVGAFLTCPLDVVKTRLQSSLYKPTSLCPHTSKSIITIMGTHIVETFEILKSIKRLEGIRGLFRGLGPNLVGIVPARAINFAAYGNGKRILTEMNGGKDSPMVHLTAAASAGIVTATVTSPIWMVKTRMQLQTMDIASLKQYRNSLDCAYQVVKAEGISGLYRGVSASYLGM
ncbi:Pyrimidine nucleotide transporter, mitochondrial [Basidiobolus ranarum]|uniref:Pyrimidine nucleotide transporter, mitochondrial n=1 Tax=Basidiobolus ranarum TaxID=34480 RepID=A0ABR2VK07_9FUNG